MLLFSAVNSIALYAAVTEALVGTGADRAAIRAAAAFTSEQMEALSGTLRRQMHAGLLFFRVCVRLRHVKAFRNLPLETRRRIVTWWAFGPISLTRKLFRPIRAIALLAYYEYASQPAAESGSA